MTTYLLKTEPNDYSYDDLARDKKTIWDGVANNAALKHIRDMTPGDEAYIYHTGDEKRVVGLAKVVSEAYADPKRPEENSRGEPKFAVVDIKVAKRAATPVTLADIKADERFAEFALVRQPRLSVMPVPAPLDKIIRKKTGL